MVFGSVVESSGHFLQSRASLAMRWVMPESVLGEIVSWCLCLAMTLSHVGGEVDILAYPLHQPMAHSYLPRGQSLPVRHRPVLLLW
jgi:hypothetical protein